MIFYPGKEIYKKFWKSKLFTYICNPKSRDDSLAQLVEHNTFNVGVLGSSPRRITRTDTGILHKDAGVFVFLIIFYPIRHTMSFSTL